MEKTSYQSSMAGNRQAGTSPALLPHPACSPREDKGGGVLISPSPLLTHSISLYLFLEAERINPNPNRTDSVCRR